MLHWDIVADRVTFASTTPVPARRPGVGVAIEAGSADALVLEPGTQIDQYELIRELGRGAMGVVFAARDTKLGRRVAIKFVLDATAGLAERFLVEARATAQCSHDNIVIIHAVDEYRSVPYMVLEFLEGHVLRDFMPPGFHIPPLRVVELCLPIAKALQRAHQLEIIHRDLKPENVFVTTAGQVKVLDFGIAKAVRDDDVRSPRTAKHSWLGTLTYMSPEQMNSLEVDHRADVWAAGVIMFEMFSGRHPVEPTTTEELVANAVSDAPMTPLASVAPEVPEALARIVDACLSKDRERRPSSAELVNALAAQLPSRTKRMFVHDECPYPGLSAFQESDADRFFGRSSEVQRMLAKIRDVPLTGVVGPSGAGKSSFVRAGVAPALKATGERWAVVTLRPGRHPIEALGAALVRLGSQTDVETPSDSSAEPPLLAQIRNEPGFVGAQMRGHARRTGVHILLFVDQLEELFTLVPDPGERLAFMAALAGVADDASAPLRVVVSMRSDFLDRVSEDPRFAEELSRGLVLLSTPDRSALREAIEQPLVLVGHRFESSAIVGDMLDALTGTPGALPLLQFSAAKLWDGRDRGRKLITNASYQAIGGVGGALAVHADDVIGGMPTAAQRLAQRIFRGLVTPERTRAIVELADLDQLDADRVEIRRVIDQLVTARLLVVQIRTDAGGGTVEIVHESLIDRWPRLRRWLDEDQEDAAFLSQLAAVAKQWQQKGRPSGLLWRGEAAREARRWHAARPRELAPRDREFLDAVFQLDQRSARTRRHLTVGAFVLLAAVAVGAIGALVSIRHARDTAMQAADSLRAEKAARDQQEREKQAAISRSAAAERDRDTADAQRVAAELDKRHAEAAVSQSREQLQQTNADLLAALRDQRVATERAQKATAEATRAAAEAQRARAALQVLLDRERARTKALEDEAKKISTKLKE